ncbi:hypothetical protein Tco_0352290 [Tanacetum coccineum]
MIQQTTSAPIPTPPTTTEAQTTIATVDHSEAIEESVQANIINDIKNQLPKFLPKAASDFATPKIKSTVNEHLDLYNGLLNSIGLDEAISSSEINPDEVLKKRLHEDQDPPTGFDKGKKRRRKRKDFDPSIETDQSSSSPKETDQPEDVEDVEDDVGNVDDQLHDVDTSKKDNYIWFTQEIVIRPETPDPEWHKEPSANDRPEQSWFPELVNSEHNQAKFDDLMGLTIDFTKYAMHHLKKDKITKVDLEGPMFNLLKGTCRSSIELEYSMEQYGHLTIPVEFFFNNDLECLKTGNTERKYTILMTKIKAAKYDLVGIEEMIQAYGAYVLRIMADKQFGYRYLKEIVVRRADKKEHTFREADFSRLHMNDIEYMFLLYVQDKIYNLNGHEIVDLVNALRMFTRSVVIKKRVEDADELYKFCDGTLKYVREVMNAMLNNFMLGYNFDMPKRAWTEKDHNRTTTMLKDIDGLLLERRIMRSLECFVGGRNIKAGLKLLTWIE